MKRILFFIIACFCFVQILKAQEKPKSPSRASFIHQKQPVYVVNGLRVSKEVLGLLNPARIDSVNVVKIVDEKMLQLYGDSAKNGIVKIQYKKEFKLLKIKPLLVHFNIKASDSKLPVYINNELIAHPDLLLFDADRIKNISVVDNDGSKKNRYLNIVTSNLNSSNIDKEKRIIICGPSRATFMKNYAAL